MTEPGRAWVTVELHFWGHDEDLVMSSEMGCLLVGDLVEVLQRYGSGVTGGFLSSWGGPGNLSIEVLQHIRRESDAQEGGS